MKVELNRDEIEEAIKRYIKTECLSQHHRFGIGEINFTTQCCIPLKKEDEVEISVEVNKMEQQTPAPCPPSY